MPFASDEVVQVATPLPLRVGVLRIAAPSEKVTVPVGATPPPELVTVAVKVTLWRMDSRSKSG